MNLMLLIRLAISLVLVVITALIAAHREAWTAEATEATAPAESQKLPGLDDPSLPAYKPPPQVKFPRARVGGISRGSLGKDPAVLALVPDHVAWTSHSRPTLYWHIDKVTTLPIVFTLREDEAVRPMLEATLSPPKQAGLQVIRLKDHGVELKEGVTYRWFVAVQRDPDSPSQDIVTGGMIERVPFVEIHHLCPSFTNEPDPGNLARCGLWYDALGVVCDKLESTPQDPLLCRQLAKLLADAGLRELAELYLKCAKA